QCSAHQRHPHSFPTRRSSDLGFSRLWLKLVDRVMHFQARLKQSPVGMMLALASDVLQHPFEIALSEADHAVAALPLQPLSGHSRSEEHTSELQSLAYLVCRLL